MTKIFINPGHSLNAEPDAGCCYGDIKEAIICHEIADLLRVQLYNCGIAVELFQQQGKKSSNDQLNQVAKVANASKAELFLSIHMNGFDDESACGTETWHAPGSVKGKKFAELINAELIRPNELHTFKNRGAKEDKRGLYVLQATSMPAALTEIGFISNAKEREFIKTHKELIAKRLCVAICKYFNIEYVESTEQLEITINACGNGLYDCLINGELKLKANKFQTCVNWLKDTYGV